MMAESQPVVGRIVDVSGGAFLAELIEQDEEKPVIVTVGDEDVHVGRLGSHLLVRQGELGVLTMVARMSERETLVAGEIDRTQGDTPRVSIANRTLRLVPLGTVGKNGRFERGVVTYPTTGAEVCAVSSKALAAIFESFGEKGYDVGYHSANASLRAYLDPSPIFGRHFAVLAQTGAGKSWALATLVQRAMTIMPKAHIILLDLHGEYSWIDETHCRRTVFGEEHARHVDATQLEIPYWLLTFAELCDLVIDRSELTAHNQLAFFRDTVLALKQKEKETLGLERVTVDTPVYFALDDLLTHIRDKNAEMVPGKNGPKQGALFGDFDRFIIRLESRLNDSRYDFLLRPKIRNSSNSMVSLLRDFVGLGELKSAVTIIDVCGVPFDVRPTVTAQIGRLAFEFNYWNPKCREFPILLVCEEAHAYVPREQSSQFEGARRSMERIAKEGRKYGVGLGIVSQRPREVSETVLAQCGTFICLRMTNSEDQAYVRGLLPEAEKELIDTLAELGRGEALVLGEGVPMPTRMLFDRPCPTPRSEDVDFQGKWRSGPDDLDVNDIVDRWRRQRRD